MGNSEVWGYHLSSLASKWIAECFMGIMVADFGNGLKSNGGGG